MSCTEPDCVACEPNRIVVTPSATAYDRVFADGGDPSDRCDASLDARRSESIPMTRLAVWRTMGSKP